MQLEHTGSGKVVRMSFFRNALIVLTVFQLIIPAKVFAHDPQPSRFRRFISAPKQGNGIYYASQLDVARCAALAEATAVLIWYAVPILETIGSGLELSAVKLKVLLGSEKAAKALLALLAVVGIQESTILGWTLGSLWDYVIEPQVEACKRVGFEFYDGAKSLPTLVSRPSFYIQQAADGIGISNGRRCAKDNMGYGPWDWFGGGFEGCKKCCEHRLTAKNALEKFQISCEAVCHAQFE